MITSLCSLMMLGLCHRNRQSGRMVLKTSVVARILLLKTLVVARTQLPLTLSVREGAHPASIDTPLHRVAAPMGRVVGHMRPIRYQYQYLLSRKFCYFVRLMWLCQQHHRSLSIKSLIRNCLWIRTWPTIQQCGWNMVLGCPTR